MIFGVSYAFPLLHKCNVKGYSTSGLLRVGSIVAQDIALFSEAWKESG